MEEAKGLGAEMEARLKRWTRDEERNGTVVRVLSQLETRSGVRREYFIYGAAAALGLYLCCGRRSASISNLLLLGVAGPSTFRILRRPKSHQETQAHLLFWAGLMATSVAERCVEFRGPFAFYFPLKLAAFLALLPSANALNPTLLRRLRETQSEEQITQNENSLEGNPEQAIN